MKQILLLFGILFGIQTHIVAQTNTWDGSNSLSWGDAANWSLNSIPSSANDVIIPTGSTISIDVAANVNSINIQGNSTVTLNNNLTFTNASTFQIGTTIIWNFGTLSGGGTLTNKGIMNLNTISGKFITASVVLNNEGTINFNALGDLFVNNGTINNQSTGIIDFKVDAADIIFSSAGSHILNNSGLIKKSAGTGTCLIQVQLNNNNSGIIEVFTGTIQLSNSLTTLNGGIYNVSNGAVLKWTNTVTCSGTLSGVLNGSITWEGNVLIASTTSANFNFTGNSFVNWTSGNLLGGGTLNNNTRLELTLSTGKFIQGGTTVLNNFGIINLTDVGDLVINDGTVNNQSTGVIDFKADTGDIISTTAGNHILNNNGLIKKSSGTGTSSILTQFTNNNSTIQVLTGTIQFSNALTTLNGGIYNVSTAAFLKWISTVTCSGTLTGVLNGSIIWEGNVLVATATTANFNFTGNSFVNWTSGTLLGGGTLNNNTKLELTLSTSKFIQGGTTILNNFEVINISDIGDLVINDGTLNNQSTGIIDFKADSGDIIFTTAGNHILNNNGLIKKSVGVGTSSILAQLNNNNSTIQVLTGTMLFSNPLTTLIGGTYTVATAAVLKWSSTVTCSGTLVGVLNGTINWEGIVLVATATSANFNFTGNSFVNWISGTLLGGGTLNNNTRLELTLSTSKFIQGETTILNNFSVVNITDIGDLVINDGTVNNQTTGIIDFKVDAGDISFTTTIGNHILNNSGIIQKTAGTGLTKILALTTNTGTIKILTGILEFAGTQGFTNATTGIVKGTATLDLPLPANFTNNGTFAPGASPGILTIIGDFKSTATSVLDIELNGVTQGTQFDLLAIQGNAIFNGTVNVTLGFVPTLNSSFIVATTTGTITQCNLPTTISTVYNGFNYTFNVACVTNNKVVLTLSQIVLANENYEFENSIMVFPNPSNDFLTLKNSGQQSIKSIVLFDSNGRILKNIEFNDNATEIQILLNQYESGIYLLKVNSEDSSIVKRIIKN